MRPKPIQIEENMFRRSLSVRTEEILSRKQRPMRETGPRATEKPDATAAEPGESTSQHPAGEEVN